MLFHELFVAVRAAEVKDLEYSSILSRVRENYEKVLDEGRKQPKRGKVVNRLINMAFTINPNDFVELVNIEKDALSFDYMSDFNPTQRNAIHLLYQPNPARLSFQTQRNAIHLLLSVVEGSQEGSYFKSFFALYIWKNLLPDVRFYSVGLTERFYQIAEERNSSGQCVFKPAEQISQLIAQERETGFFHLDECDYCDESQALIAEIDKAMTFIVKDYA